MMDELAANIARDIFAAGDVDGAPCTRLQFKSGKWPNNERDQGGLNEIALAEFMKDILRLRLAGSAAGSAGDAGAVASAATVTFYDTGAPRGERNYFVVLVNGMEVFGAYHQKKARDLYDALRKAIASARPLPAKSEAAPVAAVEGWREIASAPKGHDVLLWQGFATVGDWGDYCKHNAPQFTHWMPLPEPPCETCGGRGEVGVPDGGQ